MVVLSAVQIMFDHKITAQSALGSDHHPAATVRSQLSWSRSSTVLYLALLLLSGLGWHLIQQPSDQTQARAVDT